jgi:hypothetical protein
MKQTRHGVARKQQIHVFLLAEGSVGEIGCAIVRESSRPVSGTLQQ